MQFYTYNVLGTEMSPFRWNGSWAVLLLIIKLAYCCCCFFRTRLQAYFRANF